MALFTSYVCQPTGQLESACCAFAGVAVERGAKGSRKAEGIAGPRTDGESKLPGRHITHLG